jgi:hypothetical protein
MRSVISRIWIAFGPKAHRTDTYKFSTDTYFAVKNA